MVCTRRYAALAVCVLCAVWQPSTARAQLGIAFGTTNHFELSPSVQIEDVDDSDAKTHLARIKAYVAGGKWEEAIDTLGKVSENYGDRIIQVQDRSYETVRSYCHRQIAAMPPEALALYRSRVDATAAGWYKQGLADRDERQLEKLVDQLFCSSYGDDALLALGDLALERGHYDSARAAWQQISPLTRGSDGQQVWQLVHGAREEKHWTQVASDFVARKQPPTWLAYPGTDLDLASVQARLVLASILEGSLPRARAELTLFERLHPQATGRLAGRTGLYRDILAALLKDAERWPLQNDGDNWTTFAGAATRNKVIPRSALLSGRPSWEVALPGLPPRAFELAAGQKQLPPFSSFEPGRERLDFHPLLVGNLVLLCNQEQIFAFDARTGKPAWPTTDGLAGQIYPGGGATAGPMDLSNMFGEPRYTLSVHGDLLFARLGSPATMRPQGISSENDLNHLVCLNLRKQGALEWKYPRDNEKAEYDEGRWAFEGPPLCDGTQVYAAMRRSTFRPEQYVAAFDIRNGQMLWRRKISSADTPAHGTRKETTHNLLTLHEGTLYCNTNLGAVAALSARDGAVRWVYRYERSGSGELSAPPADFFRDLNPCIFYQGLVIVAPSDCGAIVAIDALSGQLAWKTPSWLASPDPRDIHPMHLLGVGQGNLIATGDSVWWINLATGYPLIQWPETGLEGEKGYGRGVLAGGYIYWPTREQIIVLDQRLDAAPQARVVDRIQLMRPDTNDRVTGGNLVLSRGTLLVAAERRLFAFVPRTAQGDVK